MKPKLVHGQNAASIVASSASSRSSRAPYQATATLLFNNNTRLLPTSGTRPPSPIDSTTIASPHCQELLPSEGRRKSHLHHLTAPTTLLLALLLIAALSPSSSIAADDQRHKAIDENYQPLIPFTEIPLGCESTSNGYAIANGGLEKCDVYAKEGKEEAEGDHEAEDYQAYRCAHLRVHANITRDGRCECDKSWKGPICNEYNGCPSGFSLFNGV